MNKISVAVAAPQIGISPESISYSFVFDEVYYLAGKGLDVHVIREFQGGTSLCYGIYFHGLEKLVDVSTSISTLENLPMYPPVSLLRRPATIYWENLFARNISKVVIDYKADLIHAHFAYPQGLAGLIAKKKTKKPLVVMVHGIDILVEPQTHYGLRLSKSIDAAVRWVLNDADLVIAASNATYNEACTIVRQTDKVRLIPNAVDTAKFHPSLDCSWLKKKLNIENCNVVFSLASHRPVYGLEYLIRAVPIVTKEKHDVIFVIGGDGSLRGFHERLAAELGVKEKIKFVGQIPRSQTPYYFGISDMLVVPNLQMAFGIVVSEAMACGKPVISSKVSGALDQIVDGYNGFLVAPKSPTEIAEKILWLLDNPSDAKRMGLRGRGIVEKKFNMETRIEHILLLYQELLEETT
jgi:glycosyltransferase involved in cell wall biosynthesis